MYKIMGDLSGSAICFTVILATAVAYSIAYYFNKRGTDQDNNCEQDIDDCSNPDLTRYGPKEVFVFAHNHLIFEHEFKDKVNFQQYRYISRPDRVEGTKPKKVIVHTSFWSRDDRDRFLRGFDKYHEQYNNICFENEFGDRIYIRKTN